jgi:hypothetical protein
MSRGTGLSASLMPDPPRYQPCYSVVMAELRKRVTVARAILATSAVIGLLAVAMWFRGIPLRHSDAEVRAWLLTQTPLGLNQDEVRAFIEERDWENTNPIPADEPFIAADLGQFQSLKWFPYPTTVRAAWEFDGAGKLADIRVDRWSYSPSWSSAKLRDFD